MLSVTVSFQLSSFSFVMEIVPFVGFLVTVLILLNHFFHHYWSRRGFVQLKPKFFVGDIGKLFLLNKSIAEIYGEIYEKTKNESIVGLYFLYRPALMVNDTKLIQNILVKDFPYFTNHGLYMDEVRDPLSGHLFSLRDEKWKNLRSKISPLFSTAKLKLMFPTFIDCAANLQNHVEKCAKSDYNIIGIRDLLARYTTDIIASVAYGCDNDSINDPENIFRKMGAKVFEPNLKTGIRALTVFLTPMLASFFGIRSVDKDVEDFMFEMVKETIAYREKHNRRRNDFMQVL
jgi:cytochrome P450 family 6